jgi:putative DNA primase/helicase
MRQLTIITPLHDMTTEALHEVLGEVEALRAQVLGRLVPSTSQSAPTPSDAKPDTRPNLTAHQVQKGVMALTTETEPARVNAPFSQTPLMEPELPMLTDLGNAHRFADEHKQDLRYVAKSKRWLVWDGKRWRYDDTQQVQHRAKQTIEKLHAEAEAVTDSGERAKRTRFAIQAQAAGRIAGMIELAKSEPNVPITQDALDTDPWLLTVENGTLDLRTGTLREHRREDLITKLAPVKYDPDAPCPTWEAFLKRIMAGDEDLICYLQKALGYALTGDTREQCFFILHGTGANGKSTLTTVVAKVAGGYSQHTPTETLLARQTTNPGINNDVARLHGARLVTAAEAECNRSLAEALVKQVTGGDRVTARFLHGEFFDFVPAFKLFLAVNHRPIIKGTDHAIWRRVRLIPFDVTIPVEQQDRALPDKLEAEQAGILRWLVEGCSAWLQEGLKAPEAVTNATAVYREDMDSVGAFIDECCICDPEAEIPAARLFERYSEWCQRTSEAPLSKIEFGARLSEKGFTPRRGKSDGKTVRLRRGLEVTR